MKSFTDYLKKKYKGAHLFLSVAEIIKEADQYTKEMLEEAATDDFSVCDCENKKDPNLRGIN